MPSGTPACPTPGKTQWCPLQSSVSSGLQHRTTRRVSGRQRAHLHAKGCGCWQAAPRSAEPHRTARTAPAPLCSLLWRPPGPPATCGAERILPSPAVSVLHVRNDPATLLRCLRYCLRTVVVPVSRTATRIAVNSTIPGHAFVTAQAYDKPRCLLAAVQWIVHRNLLLVANGCTCVPR